VVEQALKAMRDNPSMEGFDKQGGKLKWPTKGRVTAGFGSPRSGQVVWKGTMLSAPEGQNIRAVSGGKVIYADMVKTGEAIALVGRSGGQTEPGLYFEIRYKGQAVDPAKYCR